MKILLTVIIMVYYMDIIASQHTHHAWYPSNFLRMAAIQFQDFKIAYRKSYGKVENNKRFKVFQSNLIRINQHNFNPNQTWTMGVNRFTDLTDEEFKQTYTCINDDIDSYNLPTKVQTKERISARFLRQIPNRVDWRQSGIITDIKHQGNCASCWAFGAVEQIESYAALANVSHAELSTEEMVSCAPNIRGSFGGCNSGSGYMAYNYVKLFGISTSEQYPYTSSKNGKITNDCRHNIKHPVVGIQGYEILESNDLNAVFYHVATVGPLQVVMASKPLQFYTNGVLDCNYDEDIVLDHVAQIIGYGTDTKFGDYWLMRNSWGVKFGEGGYFRLSRKNVCGSNELGQKVCGMCGILYLASYPTGLFKIY